LSAQKLLTEQEGIFCEPASATSLAGAMHDIRHRPILQQSQMPLFFDLADETD
jgi:threonine synthase